MTLAIRASACEQFPLSLVRIRARRGWFRTIEYAAILTRNIEGSLGRIKSTLPLNRDGGEKNRKKEESQGCPAMPINYEPVLAQVYRFLFLERDSRLLRGRRRILRNNVFHKFPL